MQIISDAINSDEIQLLKSNLPSLPMQSAEHIWCAFQSSALFVELAKIVYLHRI
jgi:hypothetical protein